jgi:hypothetical protein
MNVRSRCHRILRKLAAFDRDKAGAFSAPVPSDESNLGSYVNADKTIAFALTEQALYVADAVHKHYRRVPLADISDVVRSDDLEKRLARRLMLILEDGSKIELRIDGKDDQFSDVFEIQRFFMRVQSDSRTFSDEAQ